MQDRAECNYSAYRGIKEVKHAHITGKPDSVFSDLLAFKPIKQQTKDVLLRSFFFGGHPHLPQVCDLWPILKNLH